MADKKPLKESPSQTAGPYVHIGCFPAYAGINDIYKRDIWENSTVGDGGIRLDLRLFDGESAPVTDALIEIWIADSGFWARSAHDEESGNYSFTIPKTNRNVAGKDEGSAPHVSVWIVARGINIGLHTRIYFPDLENDDDPVLSQVDEARRNTLVASQTEAGYELDIFLQGERETVFFDI